MPGKTRIAKGKGPAEGSTAYALASGALEPFSDADEGVDGGGYPIGLLKWGQAGIYNAVDDRMTITALSDSQVGIVRPCNVTAGASLTINVNAGWLAIADCGDGTTAVIGSRLSHTLGTGQGVQAGPASGGARIDLVWADTYPNDARWRLSVIRESESIGRAGVPLARITVPQGANLASQFAYSAMVPWFGGHAMGEVKSVTTSGIQQLSPGFPIAPKMIRPRSHFRLKAWGWGRMGAATQTFYFRPGLVGPTNLTTMPELLFETTIASNVIPFDILPGEQFSWTAEIQLQARMVRDNMGVSIEGAIGRGQGQANYRGRGAIHMVRCTNLFTWNPDGWWDFRLSAGWGANSANQTLECVGSTLETIEPWESG